MKSITAKELRDKVEAGHPVMVVDVREQNEFDMASMGGYLIPMSEIQQRYTEIPKEGDVVIQCRSGMRSANVIQFLTEKHGFDNLINLEGGIIAWARDVDPTIVVG